MPSLQDQLLKNKLIDKGKAQKLTKNKHKQAKQVRKSKDNKQGPTEAELAHRAQVERDRQLNLEKQRAAEEKAIKAQIRQLITMNRVDPGEGEIVYRFTVNNKIKEVYVTEPLKTQLINGQLAIAALDSSAGTLFELVPATVARKILERDLSAIAMLNEKSESETDEDDPYADFQVPDDLMW